MASELVYFRDSERSRLRQVGLLLHPGDAATSEALSRMTAQAEEHRRRVRRPRLNAHDLQESDR